MVSSFVRVVFQKEVDGDKLKQMAEWLPKDERDVWQEIAGRIAECKEQTYSHMTRVSVRQERTILLISL